MPKLKTTFQCSACGSQFPRWQGQCDACEEWNTLEESVERATTVKASPVTIVDTVQSLADVSVSDVAKWPSGNRELDRVLEGGLVPGSVMVLGGEPGIGKSTLALQVGHSVAHLGKRVLYISGEESIGQVSLRSKRVAKESPALMVLSQLDLTKIMAVIEKERPDLVILDSIQVVFHPGVSSLSGSVGQVRHCAQELIGLAKQLPFSLIMIGHITKDGSLAGPKVLEHLVDTVLFLEGERHDPFRVLRCFKNRFASTQEIGIFEMKEAGLLPVDDASSVLMASTTVGHAGSVLSAVCEGSRVLLVEVQALVVASGYGMAKRTFLGVDANRANVMIAALEKMLGLPLSTKDIILNVVGGLKVKEPSLDLAIMVAIVSSLNDRAFGEKIGVLGEVGLTGEVRAVPNVDRSVNEFARLGFKEVVVPAGSGDKVVALGKKLGISVVVVSHIRDVFKRFFTT